MAKKIRVGLVFGGKSGEHEVSLASAQSVARALDPEKYELTLIGINKEGHWLVGGNPLRQLVAAANSPLLTAGTNGAEGGGVKGNSRELTVSEGFIENVSPLHRLEVVFPLLHGPMGEDGTVQGLLELAGLPYVGAGVAASAVGMDKGMMKDIFRAHALPVVKDLVVLRSEWERSPEETISRVEAGLGYPCFVKPVNLGSSVGISKARNWDELAEGLANAAQYDRKIIVEQAVEAREIECSVLGNDSPIASLPGEVIPKREFYDYAAKYDSETGTELLVPADIPDEQIARIQALAIRAFRAIDCSGMARVDFFLERTSGQVYVNEINTIPGFTAVSMYPKMWEASGLSYPQLIDQLIQLALERHADKSRSKISQAFTSAL